MEASQDLQLISLKMQEMNTKNKLEMQTPTQLPYDIIEEIIYRLPTISNFRFKCVSKQWFSLNIEALKRKSQTLTMSGLFYVTNKGASETGVKYIKTREHQTDDSFIDGNLSFLPQHSNMVIFDSCNGLLLCGDRDSHYVSTNKLDQTMCSLYVCNPATRKWVKIPYNFDKTVRVAMLDFNPLVLVHFNVIMICNFQLYRNFEVFSSETGEWTISQVTNPMIRQCAPYNFAVFFCRGLIFAMNRRTMEINGFDVKGRLCSRIDLPGKSDLKEDNFFSRLDLLGGCLHYYYGSESKVYVWKLESDSWFLKSCFPIPCPIQNIEDIKFHPHKDELVFLLINDLCCSYNTQTTQLAELFSGVWRLSYFPYSPLYLDGLGKGVEDKWTTK